MKLTLPYVVKRAREPKSQKTLNKLDTILQSIDESLAENATSPPPTKPLPPN